MLRSLFEAIYLFGFWNLNLAEGGKKIGEGFNKFETYVQRGSKLKVIWFDFPHEGDPKTYPPPRWTLVAPGNGKFYRWTTWSNNRVEIRSGTNALSDWGACWMDTLSPLVISILFPS